MLHYFILGFFLLGANCFSDPILRKYEGKDKGKPCFLWVHQEAGEGIDYQAEVTTSYEHQGQGLGKVVLSFENKENTKLLEWQNPATGEFLRVLLQKPELTLSFPSAFRLKWVHFDHLHDATCSGLQEVLTP